MLSGLCLLVLVLTTPYVSYSLHHVLLPKLNTPVWSLATLNSNKNTNMNIVTFVSAVSIKPEPLWALSLYKSSLSYELFLKNGWGLLQLLHGDKHTTAVMLLGKKRGRDTNKLSLLNDIDIDLESIPLHSLPVEAKSTDGLIPSSAHISVLKESPVVVFLEKSQAHPVVDVGDHDLILCRVRSSFSVNGGAVTAQSALMTQTLRDLGLI